ncbi:hypothetical protein [Halobacillus sp. Marseille-P3879]|uniref:hypothetical protein n=1 Tax=Halobacillus TaxID=45667 RepID=UPI000C7E56BA|nr:hypothetical protein [Halobacillus sp. Marseille-P3879]
MKRSYLGVIALCTTLLLNIVFMQLAVHQYFYENYAATLIYTVLNIMLFPLAVIIYKREKNKGGSQSDEKRNVS